MELAPFGRLLIVVGLMIAALGLLLVLGGHGLWPRLPGDFSFSIGKARVFFPFASSLLVSVILTLLLTLLTKK